MKQIIAATSAALLVLFPAVANADGMGAGSPFVGTYVGLDLGYAWGEANSERYGNIGFPYAFTQADADIDGVTIGGHLGHNWSIAPLWVLGLEAGVGYSGLEGDDNFANTDNNEFSADWEASLQARLGFLVSPNAMLFVSGGWSWLSADSNVTNAPVESASETYSGWTLGAGVEFALTDKLNGRVQYRHSDYDNEDLVFTTNGYHMETGPEVDSVSVGLSWRL